jgi:uncharacterized alpha-E superfamily protein
MLCRTASDLLWMARHIERVDNCARLIDYAHRVALLPDRLEKGRALTESWGSALSALGLEEAYARRHGRLDEHAVLQFLIFDAENPSSIYACLHAARESGRAQRGAISAEMYEDLNSSWMRVRDLDWDQLNAEGLPQFLDWVKRRSAAFRGITLGTLVRDEAYTFLQLGTFLERADNTLRLLDMYFGETRQRPEQEASTTAFRPCCRRFRPSRPTARSIATPSRRRAWPSCWCCGPTCRARWRRARRRSTATSKAWPADVAWRCCATAVRLPPSCAMRVWKPCWHRAPAPS